ncbi:MAG: tRNA uracil 4-sulfurtransferase ThiI [Vicinamibacterales bacterium]
MSSVVIHYGELALKGRNRSWFIQTLVRNVRAALVDLRVSRIAAVVGRIVVTFESADDWGEIASRLSCIPGIGNFALAEQLQADVGLIGDAVVAGIAGRQAQSFRVLARRADKRFPVPSPQIEREIGGRVQQATGWRVDLSNPEYVIRVEVLTHEAYLFLDRMPGACGLPVGTGAKVMALLSGGIDSPVAAWRLIRRGCRTHFVHFHSYPVLSNASQDKARELVRTLTRYQLSSRLHLVAFAGIQQQVLVAVPPPLRVVIYRRMMLRIAQELARRSGAHALVTGDAVGQVASQTVDNMAVVGAVSALPVLRPLVGMDKDEITRDARSIGTYATSILPDEDCCTLFMPRSPATRALPAAVERAERAFDVAGLLTEAVEQVVTERYRFPSVRAPLPSLSSL